MASLNELNSIDSAYFEQEILYNHNQTNPIKEGSYGINIAADGTETGSILVGLHGYVQRGNIEYELTDHRGNVMAVITDKRIAISVDGVTIDHYEADVVKATDYSSFGAPLEGRTFQIRDYEYGYNGKRNDNETGYVDYGNRMYDPNIGKFISPDPITSKYPMLSPYQFASNRPIDGIDLDGLEYARYKLTVDYLSGNILSSEVIWHNAKQHNEYGSKGQGVLYEISVWDSWFKTYRSVDVQKMVNRNASALFGTVSTEYGNYMGATSLMKVGADGGFTDKYDYTLDAVDFVDQQAKLHDQGYDRVQAVGSDGLFSDWGTTPYDEAARNGWRNFLNNNKEGSKDPFNGQKVTLEERKAAGRGLTLFDGVLATKKENISEFMMQNYSKEAKNRYSFSGDATDRADQFNYELFLEKYMKKDENGNFIRRDEMWDGNKDKGFSPKTSTK
jgi:RHS repeat-associated protein